jgi:hypothetical protein
MKKQRGTNAPCRLAAGTVLLLGACSSDPPADEQTGEPTLTPEPDEVVRLRNGLEWATLREGRYLAWGMSGP